jgi:hypothetical protein
MGAEQASNQHIKGYPEWLEATYADPHGKLMAKRARELQKEFEKCLDDAFMASYREHLAKIQAKTGNSAGVED